jgi:hypothetical protein
MTRISSVTRRELIKELRETETRVSEIAVRYQLTESAIYSIMSRNKIKRARSKPRLTFPVDLPKCEHCTGYIYIHEGCASVTMPDESVQTWCADCVQVWKPSTNIEWVRESQVVARMY